MELGRAEGSTVGACGRVGNVRGAVVKWAVWLASNVITSPDGCRSGFVRALDHHWTRSPPTHVGRGSRPLTREGEVGPAVGVDVGSVVGSAEGKAVGTCKHPDHVTAARRERVTAASRGGSMGLIEWAMLYMCWSGGRRECGSGTWGEGR